MLDDLEVKIKGIGPSGLNLLEKEIIALAYAYVEAQQMAQRLAKKHGKIKVKGGSFSPIHPLRKAGLEAIGLGEEAIKEFENLAEEARKKLEEAVAQHPVWTDWASHVKGLGKLTTGLLMAAIGDISRVSTASGLWKSFGLDVTEEGKARRMEPGKKGRVGFPFARVVLGRVRLQIMRTGIDGFYYELYRQYRHYYETNRDWPKGRCFGAALRAMEKILLSHFWEVWRKSKGLSAPEPYIVAQNPLFHKKIPPEAAMEKKPKSRG